MRVTARERRNGFKVLTCSQFKQFEAQSMASLKTLDRMRSEIIRLRGAEESAETSVCILKATRKALENELATLAGKLGFPADLFEFPKSASGRNK